MNHQHIPPVALKVFCLSLLPSVIFATEELDHAGISAGIDIGGGNVETTTAGIDENKSAFYLGFNIHNRLDPNYLVGFELSGFTIESSDVWDPSEGESISQAFIVTQYYPNADSGWFYKAGAGYVSHWNNSPAVSGRKRGSGMAFGMGYDYTLEDDWTFTSFMSYCIAATDDEDHRAWVLGAGVSNRFWP